MNLGTLISVKELSEALSKDFPQNLIVLDASWHQPATKRVGRDEFQDEHIPGAQFFDLEECRDKTSEYEFMLPTASEFEEYVGKLGIKNDTHVVLYENQASGFYSSPRAWYVFRVFGHQPVSILNGGLPRWKAEGEPVTTDIPSLEKQVYKAEYNPELVKSTENILDNMKDEKFQVVDARSVGRFTGAENEPSGIPGGNIPGTLNLPFKKFMTNDEGSEFQVLKSNKEIQDIFKEYDVDLAKPLVITCGTGMTACTIVLAALMCGKVDVPVYDGSWMEYYFKMVKKD